MASSTLKRRFLFIVLPIMALVIATVLYSQYLVNKTSEASQNNINFNNALAWQLRAIQESLQDLELLIDKETLISFSQDNLIINEISFTRELVVNKISELSSLVSKNRNQFDVSSEKVKALEQSYLELEFELDRFEIIIRDRALRYPGMPILQGNLLPIYTKFVNDIDLCVNSLDSKKGSKEELERIILYKDLRYAWSQQVSWFRLFVANRSGIFGSPKASMKQNLQNRETFHAQVNELLQRLEKTASQRKLSLEEAVAVEDMRIQFNAYEENFEKVKAIYLSDAWRSDYALLINSISPQFDKTRKIIDTIIAEQQTVSDELFLKSNSVTRLITGMLWFALAVVFIIVIVGYFMFEYMVRRPVAQVSEALDAEAMGESSHANLSFKIRETQLLVDAFNNMKMQVHSRQSRLESILKNAAEGIITYNSEGIVDNFNAYAEELFGYSANEMVGKNINILWKNNPADEINVLQESKQFIESDVSRIWDSELYVTHRSGKLFPVYIKISSFELENEPMFTAIIEDISERKEMIENLQQLAEHDVLTGLHNRYYFMQEFQHLVELIARNQQSNAALLYIDLDNFKYVNDTLGHLAGDQLLIEVANTLKERTRRSDHIFRLGGDEFAVLLYEINLTEAKVAAEGFRFQIQNFVFKYQGQLIDIGCSIGLTMIEIDVCKEELLSRADYSCRAAKLTGKNKVHVYSERDKKEMIELIDDIGWTRRIKQALEHDHFLLAYQPIVNTNGETIHYEALLRMNHDDSSLIMPSGFLPPAERFGLMSEIDMWVVKNAIELYQEQRIPAANISICINLSASSIESQSVIDFITRQIERSQIDPQKLVFEITETMAMANLSKACGFLEHLQKMGCKTSLDDFGTGYASYAYLKDLPVDYVKIDGSFVKEIETNKLNREIVQSMNNIAHVMGKKTIAEFVETEKAVEILREMGVDFLQGFHIGKAEIPEEVSGIFCTHKRA